MNDSFTEFGHKLVLAALDLEPEAREEWLAEACRDNQPLLSAALARLRAEDESTIQNDHYSDCPTLETTQFSLASKKPVLRRVNHWQLERVLGEGGMGAVWLADRVDGEVKMQAAVKFVRAPMAHDNFLTRFRRERQIMADLKHPYIGTLYDAGTTGEGQPYLVMEYVDGDTITRFCDTRVPELHQRIQLFQKACEAVAFAHKKGIIHRDIKPGNIMVSAEGIPKLLDFGIAFHCDPNNESHPDQKAMTPEFASPELMCDGTAGVQSDIYALGLVLAEMVIGKRPRDLGNDKLNAIDTHLSDDPHLRRLLKTALAHECQQRFDSVRDLMGALDHYLVSNAPQDTAVVCHYDALVWLHSDDRGDVEALVSLLEIRHSLSLWLPGRDGDDPGVFLMEAACLLVCMGAGEPWQNHNQRAALEEAIDKQRVVPILLGNAHRPERESNLPVFLRRRAWLDYSESNLESLARTIRGLVADTPTGDANETCPFRGLEVFREQDRHFFFGREAMIQRLCKHVDRHRFLAVLGQSGSGKSSVVQAGLIPHLRQQNCAVAMITPATKPLNELAFALHQNYPTGDREPSERLAQRLRAGDEAFYFIIREICLAAGIDRLYLVVDQFEEVFTLASDQSEVARFLAGLLYAVEQPDARLVIVVTLRSDFVGRCAIFPDLNTYLIEHALQIEPMNREQLQQAISEPARAVGLHFEEGLVDRISDDVAGASSELPLLEHALLELWERRRGRLLTLAAYVEIGGIEGALARRAETEFTQLNESQQQTLRKMFTLCLVQPGEGVEDTRRRATRKELLAISSDPEMAAQLLDQWSAARLLTGQYDEQRQLDMVDVAHEALIRNWLRIGTWMSEDRETSRQINRLRQMAIAWEEAGRDEDHLLRGGPLLHMGNLVEKEADHLDEREKAFVQASFAARHRVDREQKRHQRLILTGTFIGALVTLILALFAQQKKIQAEEARDLAQEAQNRAEQQTLEANYNQALIFDEKTLTALNRKKPQSGWLYAMAALSQEIPDDRSLAAITGHLANPQMDQAERLLWTSPIGFDTHCIAFGPHNMLLALARHREITIMDLSNGQLLGVLEGHSGLIMDLAFNPNGDLLASVGNDFAIILWDITEMKQVRRIARHSGPVTSVAFDPRGEHLLSGSNDRTLRLWHVETGLEIAVLEGHEGIINAVTWQSGGHLAASASADKTVRIWDMEQRKQLAVLKGHTDEVGHVVFAGQDSIPVSSSKDGSVRIWDLIDGSSQVLEWSSHEQSWLAAVSGTNDLLTNTIGGNLTLWDLVEKKQKFTYCRHRETATESIAPLAWQPDGSRFATATEIQGLVLWDRSGIQQAELSGPKGLIWGTAFSPNGASIASACYDETIKIWDVETSKQKQTLFGHMGPVWDVVFSHDGNLLASASGDRTIRLWSERGQHLRTLTGHTDTIWGLSFSPDDRLLASASRDKTVIIWDVKKEMQIQTLRGHTATVWALDFSPNGHLLATASWDNTIRLWSIPQGKCLRILEGHSSSVRAIDFSPDGRYLCSSGDDFSQRIWRVTDGIELFESARNSYIFDLAFSPNGKWLVSGEIDGNIKIESFLSRENRGKPTTVTLMAGESLQAPNAYDISFSPDGTKLISTSGPVKTWPIDYDGHMRLWQFPQGIPDVGHLQAITRNVTDFAVSPRDPIIAFFDAEHDVQVRYLPGVVKDQESTIPAKYLSGHTDSLNRLVFSSDGAMMATASRDKTIRLWSMPDGVPLGKLTGHKAEIDNLVISPDRRRLVSIDVDDHIAFWKITNHLGGNSGPMKPEIMSAEYISGIRSIDYSPRDSLVVTTSAEKTARIWDAEKGLISNTLEHSGAINEHTFSPDGSLLAIACEDGSIRIWEMPIGRLRFVIRNNSTSISGLSFSPDGKYLAFADDQTILLWNMPNTVACPPLQVHSKKVNSVTFSSDGKQLITCSNDNTIALWRIPEGRLQAVFRGHDDFVRKAVFAWDNSKLISLADDRTMRLWNLDSIHIFEDTALRKELLKRGLYHFGYRMEGIKLKPIRRSYLAGINGYQFPQARPYQHLDEPPPPNAKLIDWLMENL